MKWNLTGLCPVALLAACALPAQQQVPMPTQSNIPPAAWYHAEQQADRFDRAFKSGGMSGVAEDIDRCYRQALASGNHIFFRDCLVYDDFADRFAAQMNKQAHFPIPAFFQPANVYPRLSRYSGPAGFNDAEIMSGYLREGSNTIFAVIASRTRPPQG